MGQSEWKESYKDGERGEGKYHNGKKDGKWIR
jgi:hypothetical protein